jgi:hypothetical protein
MRPMTCACVVFDADSGGGSRRGFMSVDSNASDIAI